MTTGTPGKKRSASQNSSFLKLINSNSDTAGFPFTLLAKQEGNGPLDQRAKGQ